MTDAVIAPSTIANQIKENELKAARYDFLIENAVSHSKKSGLVVGGTLTADFSMHIWCSKEKFEMQLDDLIAKNKTA